MSSPHLSPPLFSAYCELIQSSSGIRFGASRERMLESRITSRMQHLGLNAYDDYLRYIRTERDSCELNTLIDSVTTNFTSFFRDARQFAILSEALESMLAQGKRKVRVWSAACSSGEEPVSIAIAALEAAKRTQCETMRLRILATDISRKVLTSGSCGHYSAQSIAGLAAGHQSYFVPVHADEASQEMTNRCGALVTPIEAVRELIIWRRLNLAAPDWRDFGDVDFVFCRNVLIYFDEATQAKVLSGIAKRLAPGGWLFVGACESVRHLLTSLEPVAPSVFRKPPYTVTQRSYVTDLAKRKSS